ncbi:MAG: endo-1,4-beta-xylanase [Chitinophagaceae bacterium]
MHGVGLNLIRGITFWNSSDRRSWLDNNPVKGRKNYPLLFNKVLKPKSIPGSFENCKIAASYQPTAMLA